jgi:hypothetical protein
MRALFPFISMVAGVALLGACEDSSAKFEGGETAKADPVAERWKSAGLELGTAKALEKSKIGDDCIRYDIEGVTALLCDFADAKAAGEGRKRGLSWIGNATGAALVHESRLLVVADRDGTDPHGKAINKITKLFLNLETAEKPAAVGAAKPVDGEEVADEDEAEGGSPAGLGSLIPKVEGGE